ncbi:hypothetical protein [Amnibacterium kyonggiense]|uniref:Glycosyl transferase family 8 n=1 Tax=Amnibacterium kyonggiense TaxID=595671 RepID=A0A4R7FDB7_9MICO|nr:hypothetical protein [Amnibacterium kyonggiense]TDS74949.1 hypothetical protein CLV52_3473 [Amnibacterium kyonggiense]
MPGTATGDTVYCTVVARNYLPQALALHASIQRHQPDRHFVVLVVDGEVELEERPGLELVGLEALALPEREQLDLAAIYDVVELSTGVKPRFMLQLLERYERAVYLDPDLYLVSSIEELDDLMDEHGVVLTPHILEPIPPGESFRSEINTLTVGVHNLGFCAVGRAGRPFLEWWWSHLERECLIYPLLGLFVDQKWTDIGATMFDAHSLRHYGYNIGHWNLHERRFSRRDGSLVMDRTGEPLRFFHFSGFDPNDPEAISERQTISLKDTDLGFDELVPLSREYAALVLQARSDLGASPRYGFDTDSSGRPMTKRLRRTYRKELIDNGPESLPSPFIDAQREAFAKWRARSLPRQATNALADSSLAFKYAFPDTYNRIKRTAPAQFRWVRGRLLAGAKIRR